MVTTSLQTVCFWRMTVRNGTSSATGRFWPSCSTIWMLTAPRYNSLMRSQNCFQTACGISVVICLEENYLVRPRALDFLFTLLRFNCNVFGERLRIFPLLLPSILRVGDFHRLVVTRERFIAFGTNLFCVCFSRRPT